MKRLATIITAVCAAFMACAGEFYKIPLREAANFGLSDNGVAGDGKGGFTDDGVNLGEISYKDGENLVFGAPFDLIDPAKNGGKALLTFECGKSKTGLRRVEIDLSGKNAKGESLALLHGSTKSPDVRFTKIGRIDVVFEDGKTATFVLDYAVDVMNSLAPQERANAKIWRPAKSGNKGYFFSRFIIPKKTIKKIIFSTEDVATWFVAAATIEEKFPSWQANGGDWVAADMSKIAVAEGSALDVSKDFSSIPASKTGRVIMTKRGKFAFEKNPKKTVKFHGMVWYMAGEIGKTDDETRANLARLCKIVKRQGYNLLRFHTTDFLCSQDPTRVARGFDLYDYLISEAGKNGVYLNLLIGNNDLGAKDFKWEDRYSLKMKMLMGDPQTREAWRAHAKRQLEHVNPYTGLAWKDDPAFMAMEYWNEMDLLMNFGTFTPDTVKLVNSEFAKFLAEKYGTPEKMNAEGKLAKKNYKSFDEINFKAETNSCDWGAFMRAKNREFVEFCENVVKKEIGYGGLIYQYNCNRSVNIQCMSSEAADYSALNVYFAHPSAFMRISSGVNQKSSFENGIPQMRAAMAHKIAGRPMVCTEYNHCHWNPYKYEGGLAFGAYAALQDFDGMVVHCSAVRTNAKPDSRLENFAVFNSPIMRANEFITYCLFMRGDAKKSKKYALLKFTKEYMENDPQANNELSPVQGKIPFVMGFAVEFEGSRKTQKAAKLKPKKPAETIFPVGSARALTAANFASTGASVGADFDLAAFFDSARKNGLIPEGNITSPNDGIFQSDTGEIVLDMKKKKMTVITPRTEAVAFTGGKASLGELSDISSTVPCSAAVSSMDGNPIAQSQRLVLVYATDNANDETKLSLSRETLLKNATRKTRVMLLRGKLSAKLRLDDPSGYKLYALAADGTRTAEIPAQTKDGFLIINIDNSKTPTTFFEIAKN